MNSSNSDRESVSIVIVNFNGGVLLSECVKAALEQARQVIIVDNASYDNSLRELAANCPSESRLRVIQTGRNLGFAAGCNIGTSAAEESCILFLNPDCKLARGAVSCMVEALEADAGIGMAGGLLINPDGTEQPGGRRVVPTPWRSFIRAFGLSKLGSRYPKLFSDFLLHREPLPDAPVAVEAISGACMMVRRRALTDVGPLDEGYFLHCEDLDWCMRFHQKGWQVMFVPGARVVHALGGCSANRPIFVEWHKHKGMMRYYRKFFHHRYPGVLFWFVGFGVWLRFGATALYYSGKGLLRGLKKAMG